MGGFSRVYAKGDLNLGFTKDDSAGVVERNREYPRVCCGAEKGILSVRETIERLLPPKRKAAIKAAWRANSIRAGR